MECLPGCPLGPWGKKVANASNSIIFASTMNTRGKKWIVLVGVLGPAGVPVGRGGMP